MLLGFEVELGTGATADQETLRRLCIEGSAPPGAGAVAQATAGSLTGQFRGTSMRAFRALLEKGRFHLLASDAHSTVEYTWSPAPALAELGKHVSPEDRTLLTESNPARILSGRWPLPLAPRR